MQIEKEQFILLADCINEVRAFQNDISPEELENFFFCRLEGAFKSKNNRTIAYIMNALYLNNYINESWQAVIEKHQLVLSPMKEGYVKANDLSSANNNYPKGAEIIDDYIKQLKKH
ncbi:MAG: hypothetical protein LUF85_17170 [Bacteroides sp.]|nr:hypothetical protein [Bacteroides sp.]